eukprot:1152171-Pelagomonas_calceolata.AAC.11
MKFTCNVYAHLSTPSTTKMYQQSVPLVPLNHQTLPLLSKKKMDTGYHDILLAVAEGQMSDFTDQNSPVWYTLGNDIQPTLYVPQGDARQHLISEPYNPATSGHLDIHKTHETLP